MGLCDSPPSPPDPSAAAVGGIQADLGLQPYNYLINAAATMGVPITIAGHTYDFTGAGQAGVAAQVSDQMAQTLLSLQQEKDPTIIAQRLAELQAADPQGYAARQDLFNRIMADANTHPNSPVSPALQQELQRQLDLGTRFNDARQLQQAQEAVRGGQVARGIYLGNAPAAQEANAIVNAGETLQQQRQANALNLLSSGASPQDVAYRQFQQSLGNLGAFQTGQTPSAQFAQVSSASQGPAGAVPYSNPAAFNPNAAASGMQNALSLYSGQVNWNQSQANPWLAGLSIGTTTAGTLANINPSWFSAGTGGAGGTNVVSVNDPNWNSYFETP